MRSERIWGIWALTSEIILEELASLHDVKINPQNIDEVVEHYSIPAWESLTPDLVHSTDIESNKIVLPDEEHILVSCLNPSTHKVWRVTKNNSTIKRLASTEWAVVVPHNSEETDYINSALEGYFFQFQMNSYVTGTTNSHQRVRKKDFMNLKIQFPDKKNRKKIGKAHKLIREKIALSKKFSELNSDYVSALFRSWFIDFDPVKARAEGKVPFGMDEETATQFPDSFEDSELGPVPAGWKWGYLGDCISVVGGGTPSTKNKDFWGGKYNWTSPKDLSNSNSIIMLDTERTITEEGLTKISSGLLPENTVLMSSRAPIGYLALTKIPVAINQGYIAIPPKNNMSPNFMLSWIHYNMPLIEAYSSGSTFPEISKKEFRKLPILIPPSELIEKFNEKTTPSYDSMETSLKQMNSLKNTRDALLPRLMSEELKVN